jgi:hypothetical protein
MLTFIISLLNRGFALFWGTSAVARRGFKSLPETSKKIVPGQFRIAPANRRIGPSRPRPQIPAFSILPRPCFSPRRRASVSPRENFPTRIRANRLIRAICGQFSPPPGHPVNGVDGTGPRVTGLAGASPIRTSNDARGFHTPQGVDLLWRDEPRERHLPIHSRLRFWLFARSASPL